MDITKRIYKLVKTVAEEKNISHAAEALYISQPALTKALNQLEEELGTRLFDRSCKPIRLLPAGELFLDKAGQICDLTDELERELTQLEVAHHQNIRLGIANSRAAAWLPHILPAFTREYPSVKIAITETDHYCFPNALQKNKIDLAVGSDFDLSDQSLGYQLIRNENWILITNAERPYVREANLQDNSPLNPLTIDLKDIINESLILPTTEIWLRRSLDDIFRKNRFRFPTVIPANDITSAYLMASAGVGVTFTNPYLPLTIQASRPDTILPVYCSIRETADRPIYFSYRRDYACPDIIKAFISVTLKTLQDHPER